MIVSLLISLKNPLWDSRVVKIDFNFRGLRGECLFIFKTRSDEILAKLVNRGGGGGEGRRLLVLFSHRHFSKLFLCMKIAEIDMVGQFWVEKNECGLKNFSFSS